MPVNQSCFLRNPENVTETIDGTVLSKSAMLTIGGNIKKITALCRFCPVKRFCQPEFTQVDHTYAIATISHDDGGPLVPILTTMYGEPAVTDNDVECFLTNPEMTNSSAGGVTLKENALALLGQDLTNLPRFCGICKRSSRCQPVFTPTGTNTRGFATYFVGTIPMEEGTGLIPPSFYEFED